MSTTKEKTMSFSLPDLPYNYEDLEPVINAEIMMLHHSKHHQAYVNNLNAALEKYQTAQDNKDVASMIALQSAIKFNGGGHVNHSIFWTNLAPKNKGGGELPAGAFKDKLEATFGSFDKFVSTFNTIAAPIQGSGWCWLGLEPTTKALKIETCANQDPLSTKGLVPLLGIDVWEHAYYLQYKNARPQYLEAIWDVVNWRNVIERFSAI